MNHSVESKIWKYLDNISQKEKKILIVQKGFMENAFLQFIFFVKFWNPSSLKARNKNSMIALASKVLRSVSSYFNLLFSSLCGTMGCRSFEWILNNDDNDIFGETWCAVDGYGMCYCCECPWAARLDQLLRIVVIYATNDEGINCSLYNH